ncbi:CehA/McbA family metallohydrolase [Mycolicibacterium stellerae]|uniref:CehA/McbA family metallohydrolase n=1 Tax=Mycolicibacterium stellerae TaxID=2358193 RepID=UPI000F0AFB34|nr:CehA/McbA family metallohydrolase [Mycolicibacterium stellerae]
MTALRTDTGIALSYSGRFKFGIDQWEYVPFDVPEGINRIDVHTSHDQFSLLGIGRNVLDLGIFGPAGHQLGNTAGFRGWSGGARAGFVLSAVNATPGYLAGPIDPGRWALALGPVVLNPLGMDWQAQVVLTEGVQPSLRGEPRAHTAACKDPRAGWYRGDLHTHTVHSDGRRRIEEMAAAAEAAGLDFIVSTDHNTNSANRAWTASSTDLEVIAGEEVTTRHGHWLAVGLPQGGWVDWRYGPRDGVFSDYAAQVRADGGLVVAAHPSVPLPGCAWEFGYHDVDAIEVWNGVWNVDDELSLRIWHQLLRQGRRVTAVGGSDSHVSDQPVGRPQTIVFAEELSTPGIVDGLRRGRCYVAESGAVSLVLNASHDCNTVTVAAEARGAPNCTISLITDGGCVGRAKTDDDGVGGLTWTAASGTARFARVEVRRRARFPSMVALSNPMWLNANRPSLI